jgi:hypothetical protein
MMCVFELYSINLTRLNVQMLTTIGFLLKCLIPTFYSENITAMHSPVIDVLLREEDGVLQFHVNA